MIEKEENAWQHFEELKDILQMFSLGWWKKNRIMLTSLLKIVSLKKNLSLQYHAKTKRRKMTASTSMGYDVWWLVLSKNGS